VIVEIIRGKQPANNDMSIIDICEKVSFNSFDANGSIDK
jgi:hypothetical protein